MMIDQEIKLQLENVFSDLKSPVSLVMKASKHEKQAELRDMLKDVASTSNYIELIESEEMSAVPEFAIFKGTSPTGINFKGIPGGHEFTSLIVAILNTCGKGKFPDAGIQNRIKNLPSKTSIRTYISLSCENCPDVVQALNLITLVHGNMEHTMVDGGLVQDELKTLNISGVPSVYIAEKMIHAGKASFAEILQKIEDHLGSHQKSTDEVDLGHFDIAVLGGGPAGISAAIYAVRKGLKTALIAEKIGGQVTETKGIENLISQIYTEGPELTDQLDKHLRSYPVEVFEHRKIAEVSAGKSKKIGLSNGEFLSCNSLIVATGAKWRELGIPGEKEYLGRGVAFCPHCDGPFYKNKKVAVIGGGNSGVEAAIDLSGICSEVVLLEYADSLKADTILINKLESIKNIQVITSAKTTLIEGDGSHVTQMTYEDRKSENVKTIELDGIFVQIGLIPNSSMVKNIVDTTSFGEIIIDEKCRTSVPGIYAAGDVSTTPYKQIIISMGEGAKASLAAFEDRMRGE